MFRIQRTPIPRVAWWLGAVTGLGLFFLGPVGLAAPAPRQAVAPAASLPGLTARRFAARLQMHVVDEGDTVTLRGPLVTVRLYPGTNRVSVLGDAHRLKDPIQRAGRAIRIPPRPAAFLGREILTKRRQIFARREAFHVPTVPVPAPARVKLGARPRPRPAVVPAPKRSAPRARARAAEPAPDPRWIPHAPARAWKWIVIHHSADPRGNAAKYDRIHREKNGWDSLGYHFVIGNGSLSGDGEIEVGPRWPIQKHGAHARNHDLGDNRYNEAGIGICLVGDFDRAGREPSPAQMGALVRLVRWLMKRYDIPASMVVRHRDCCHTQCPGRHFPWNTFKRRIR